MSEVPDRNAASASAEASNPFAPIDYASRLKAPSKHTGAFHAMQPLQPGQLYGAAPWMSPPKPLASNPAPQESEEVLSGQGAPSFSAAFPPYTYPSPTVPVSPAKARRPPPIFRPISRGGPSWVATRRMPNRRRKPEWTCTAPQIFSPLFSRTRSPRNRRYSPLRHPSSSMRPTAPAAAGWRVIRWRKPPSPTQRQKAKPPLPLRTRCRLCRRCRQAFPSSRLPRMLLFAGNPAVSRGRQPRRALCAAVSARRALPACSCG